ncbi:Cyclic nucleotide-binding domain [Popillia japonica]|uniref:Cyclic nucleotide-binding domain n=1 Tax=Popillia japonica TaxID=7064 RepID=A0AAW1L5S6_POPJA
MGVLVVDKKLIIKGYMKFNKFYIELIGSFPTDFLYFVFPYVGSTKSQLHLLLLARLNRLVRVTSVYNYFNIKHDYLNINVLLIKLSSIFIYLTVLIHAQACIWHVMACPNNCSENSWVYSNGHDVCAGNKYLCSLYAATSLATFTGFSPPHARTEIELIMATVLMICDKFALGVFIGYMTSIVHNVSSTLVQYDHRIKKLKDYLRNSKISLALVDIVLNYTYQLWNRNQGLQVPIYLTTCPAFIQEDIKISAFGYHIHENEIFVKCHPDFLRLLIGRLHVTTFFNGNIICQQGDVNHTMYFIHQGGVNVYKVNDTEEILIDQLKELDSFGILQGVVEHTPHTHTYVASDVAIILTLLLSDWKHLLTFFPASCFTIYSKVADMWSREKATIGMYV